MPATKVVGGSLLQQTLDSLNTGDVLIYRTKDLGAYFNMCVQHRPASHVGLVVRGHPEVLAPLFPDDYRTEPLSEASGSKEDRSTASLCVFEAVPRRGVSLFPLKDRLARTASTISGLSVRRRRGPDIAPKQQAQLEGFMREVRGRRLEVASTHMAKALFCGYRPNHKHEDWSRFFCSELVAEGLQQLEVLREDGLNSNDVLPRNFLTSAALLRSQVINGHSYGDEEHLIGEGSTHSREMRADCARHKEACSCRRKNSKTAKVAHDSVSVG